MICRVQEEKITNLGKNKNQKELRKQLFLVFIIYGNLKLEKLLQNKKLNSFPKIKNRKSDFISFFLHLKNNK